MSRLHQSGTINFGLFGPVNIEILVWSKSQIRALLIATANWMVIVFRAAANVSISTGRWARNAFVGGACRTCLKEQRGAQENASLSTSELEAFCLCYGRAIADIVNGAEYKALTAGRMPPSFADKQRQSADACISRMSVTKQPSQDKQAATAIENR